MYRKILGLFAISYYVFHALEGIGDSYTIASEKRYTDDTVIYL